MRDRAMPTLVNMQDSLSEIICKLTKKHNITNIKILKGYD